jgi:hypothetical protein
VRKQSRIITKAEVSKQLQICNAMDQNARNTFQGGDHAGAFVGLKVAEVLGRM